MIVLNVIMRYHRELCDAVCCHPYEPTTRMGGGREGERKPGTKMRDVPRARRELNACTPTRTACRVDSGRKGGKGERRKEAREPASFCKSAEAVWCSSLPRSTLALSPRLSAVYAPLEGGERGCSFGPTFTQHSRNKVSSGESWMLRCSTLLARWAPPPVATRPF